MRNLIIAGAFFLGMMLTLAIVGVIHLIEVVPAKTAPAVNRLPEAPTVAAGMIRIHTIYGDLKIPQNNISSVETSPNLPTVIQFKNGDKLTAMVISPVPVPAVINGEPHETNMPKSGVEGNPHPVPTMKVFATASEEWQDHSADLAFDGDNNTFWNAGVNAPAWIQADLGNSTPLGSINLVFEQSPAGPSIHELYISEAPITDAAPGTLAHTWAGKTPDTGTYVPDSIIPANHQLNFKFPEGTHARYLRINTTQDPGWVAWREIKITPKSPLLK